MPHKIKSITQRFDQLLRSALSVLDEVVNENYHPGEDDLEGLCCAARKLREDWRSIEVQPHQKPRPARRAKTRNRSKRSAVGRGDTPPKPAPRTTGTEQRSEKLSAAYEQ